MKFYVRENSRIARMAAARLKSRNMALVIRRTIYLHGISKEDFLANGPWLQHELTHVAQYKRYGTLGFLIRYLYESWKHGYYNNRYEIEARAAEGRQK